MVLIARPAALLSRLASSCKPTGLDLALNGLLLRDPVQRVVDRQDTGALHADAVQVLLDGGLRFYAEVTWPAEHASLVLWPQVKHG